MSDRLTLVEPSVLSDSGINRCNRASRESVLDKISAFALGLVVVGLIFSGVGFLYPRSVNRDPQASARENELVDQEFMRTTEALNAVIISGMVFIGLGGLIISAVFTNSVVCQECHQDGTHNMASTNPQTCTESTDTVGQHASNYGTVSSPASPH